MKKLTTLCLLALTVLSFGSCIKGHTCNCPSGTSVSVSTNDESRINQMCMDQSNGRCTK